MNYLVPEIHKTFVFLLVLNVDKTKEIVTDVRKNKVAPRRVMIKEAEVERVETYEYI